MWAAPRCEPPHQPTVLFPATHTGCTQQLCSLPSVPSHSSLLTCSIAVPCPVTPCCITPCIPSASQAVARSKQLHTPHPTCGSWGLSSQSSLGLKPQHGESHIPQFYAGVHTLSCPGWARSLSRRAQEGPSPSLGTLVPDEDTWGPLPGWDGAVVLLLKFLWDVERGQAAIPPPSPPTLPGNDAQLSQGMASARSCCPGLSHAHPCPHSHLLKLPRIQGTHLPPNHLLLCLCGSGTCVLAVPDGR